MRWAIFLFFISFSLGLFGQESQKQRRKTFTLPKGVTSKDYVPNLLIVKFRNINFQSNILLNEPRIREIKLSSASIVQVRQIFNSKNEVKINAVTALDEKLGLDRIVEIRYSSVAGIEQIANEILKNNNIEYVEPRYIYHKNDVANDPRYNGSNNDQSYLNQVHVPEAWQVLMGSMTSMTSVIVGVVDSGSEVNHPDLATNIYHNEADPIDGIDNDKDGYIDNYNGWDFGGANQTLPKADNNPNVVSSRNAHGVHVSGLVSAATNNELGIASVAFNHAKLLIVKVSADDDPTGILYGYEGIKYAVDKGAKIINCSWGGGYGGSFGEDIINYAIEKDCLVVAAAGNEGAEGNPTEWPAAYEGVLAVASVSDSDTKSWFSNYGSHVSISAPGEHILSTWFNNSYAYSSGTSMAAPIVSSTAALVKALSPSLTMEEVAKQLKSTADEIDEENSYYTGLLGTGRLNVYRALTGAPPTRFKFKLIQNYPNPSFDNTTIDFSIPANSQTTLLLYSLSGKLVKEIVNKYLDKGSYSYQVSVGDLERGIYLCRLQYGNLSKTIKIQVGK